jgi:hypothetical protein
MRRAKTRRMCNPIARRLGPGGERAWRASTVLISAHAISANRWPSIAHCGVRGTRTSHGTSCPPRIIERLWP